MAIKFRPTSKSQIGRNLKNVPIAKLPQKAVAYFKKLGGTSAYSPLVAKKRIMETFAKKYQNQIVKMERDEMGLNPEQRKRLNDPVFGIKEGLTEEQKEAKEQRLSALIKMRRMESGGKLDAGEKIINDRAGTRSRVLNRGFVDSRRTKRRTSASNQPTSGAPSAITGAGAHGVAGDVPKGATPMVKDGRLHVERQKGGSGLVGSKPKTLSHDK
jgi:hypothetical protein